MCSWDIISDVIDYTNDVYAEVDIRDSKKNFRRRSFERIMVDDIVEKFCDRPYNDPIDILEQYEILYEYKVRICKDDIHKIQLNVIRKILIFLRKREKIYG